jgi:hypothetical protein
MSEDCMSAAERQMALNESDRVICDARRGSQERQVERKYSAAIAEAIARERDELRAECDQLHDRNMMTGFQPCAVCGKPVTVAGIADGYQAVLRMPCCGRVVCSACNYDGAVAEHDCRRANATFEAVRKERDWLRERYDAMLPLLELALPQIVSMRPLVRDSLQQTDYSWWGPWLETARRLLAEAGVEVTT